MKSYLVYKDKDVKRFKHVTVVEGKGNLKESTYDQLAHLNSKLDYAACELYGEIKAKGRSKCSPSDTYDEKLGLIVASRKAELKVAKAKLVAITKVRKAAEEYLELLKNIEDKLDYKVGKLNLDLVRINRGN